MFTYRTYSQFNQDIAAWEPHLPVISAVAGIPRSGIIAASMISQLRYIPLVPIEAVAGCCAPFRPGCSRRIRRPQGPILIIDDTCNRGRTKQEMRGYIDRKDVLWGAVYATDHALRHHLVDLAGYQITTPNHAFEWNLLRDGITKHIATDLDGVLCHDWPGEPNDCGPEYEHWLETVQPLRLPTEPVRAIITGRLERFRPQTEAWLARHGVKYGELCMHPGDDPTARDHVGHKVAQFRRIYRNTSMFLESCPRQAAAIARRTRWAVVCYSTGEAHNQKPMIPLF